MNTADTNRPNTNRILSALPRDEYERISPRLEYTLLTPSKILYRPGESIAHVYFPLRGTVSITAMMEDGREVEVGIVGREGMLGLPLVLGTDTAPLKAAVQVPDGAMRLRAGAFGEELERGRGLRRLLLRYAQAFFIQTAITAACNRLHEIERRLARWMLMCQDRTDSDLLPMTHEFFAQMLGAGRPSVTLAAGSLQKRGLITYKRGKVKVNDRAGLERAACECYGVVRRERTRLMENGSPAH